MDANLPAQESAAATERFVEICQQEAIARARTEELRQALFADERVSLSRERQQLIAEREQWQRRREREQQRLAHEAEQLERQKQAVRDTHGEINSELDLNRRRLEASWNQFRKEQHDWQARRAQEETGLRQRLKELERGERTLEQARRKLEHRLQEDHAVARERTAELQQLEQRIGNYRRAIASLQDEAIGLESRLAGSSNRGFEDSAPATLQDSAPATLQDSAPATLQDSAPATLQDSAPANLRDHPPGVALKLFDGARSDSVIDQILGIVEEVHDECRRLLEDQAGLAELQRAWESHRQDLARRAQELGQREAAVRQAEDAEQRRSLVLERELLELRRDQSRLAVLRGAFHSERSRLVALIRARGEANREQRRLLIDLERDWIATHGDELKRCEARWRGAETARRAWLRRLAVLEQRLEALQERERQVHEKDLVLTQAQQQLIARDPHPAEAEKELQRRRMHWARLATRPLRGLRRQKDQLERRLADLEKRSLELLEDRRALEADRARFLQIADQLKQRETDQAAERSHWRHALAGLEQERGILEKRILDLEQEVDHLASLLVGESESKPLSIAA